MKIFNNWFVCFIFVLTAGTAAWAQPNFTIGSVSGNQNDVVAVDIRVDNFDNLIGFQIPIRWDAGALNYVSHENLNSGLNGVAFATPPGLPEGQLNMNWFDSNNPVTIDNGSLFLTINFRLVGAPGTSSMISFLDDPNRLEAISATNPAVNIGVNFVAGTIQNLGSGAGDAKLILENQTVDMGDNFCMRVRVQNFMGISALQYNINWDPAVIQFNEIRNFNLPGLDVADFNTANTAMGQLRMAWISNATGGETLADNTTIFEICFTATGTGGSSTGVTFSDVVSQPDVETTDGSVSINGGIEGLSLIIGDGTGPVAGIICTDLTVNDFTGISAFQFSINWDPALYDFSDLNNIDPGVSSGFFDFNPNLQAGAVVVSGAFVSPLTLTNNSVLFSLCLDYLGSECNGPTPVELSGNPLEIVIADTDGQIPLNELTLINGSVEPTCGPDLPTITCDPETTDIVACNGDEGSIFVTVLPADEDYTYTWNGQASQSEDLENVKAGEYTLVVTQTSTNETATKTVIIGEPDAIVIDGVSTDVTGSNEDGTITINSVSGGTGTLTCLWNPEISPDCSGADGLAANTYTLTVVDENDCSATAEFVINSAEFNFSLNSSNAICATENGDCGGRIEVTIDGGTGPYTYTINGDDFDGVATDLCAGDYEIAVTDSGLNETKSSNVSLTGPDPLTYNIVKTDPSEIMSTDGMAYVTNISGGTSPYDIIWPGTVSDTLSNVGSGLYQLTIVDDNGCLIQEMVELIDINIDRCFEGASVITPNGDGRNDQFIITCTNNFNNTLQIYNRWGQRVHTQSNYDNSWNGTDLNGNNLEDGVYYWVLLVDSPDASREIKGYVNLLRNLK